jgi:predicted signal transduction protein with EAL and GGDEF domain
VGGPIIAGYDREGEELIADRLRVDEDALVFRYAGVCGDRELVTDLGNDAASETILTSLIALGHGLGMTVVSEGVETEEQRDELSRLGCDYLQGFYLARPVSGATLEALIKPGPDGHAPHLPSP